VYNNEKDSDDYKRTQEIRAILLKDWDPLGIGDNPNLADEYDHYIPAILRLFDTHGTVEELERYLADIEEKWELTPIRPLRERPRRSLML
jgi:hypothetical protein